jgi:hypothetical protein
MLAKSRVLIRRSYPVSILLNRLLQQKNRYCFVSGRFSYTFDSKFLVFNSLPFRMHALFLTLLVSASAFAYNPFSAFSGQRPLSTHINSSNQPTLLPFPRSWVLCPDPAHWECRYSAFASVWCRCVVDVLASGKAKTKPKTGGWIENEDATSLEVMAEIQPGNNETMVSLFVMHCEEESHVGCVSWGGGGFVCGCHGWGCGSTEEAPGNDYENDAELNTMEDEEPELGESRLTKSGNFRFQRFQYPRCNKPGYHIKCCSYQGKSHCFCAGNGVRCPS